MHLDQPIIPKVKQHFKLKIILNKLIMKKTKEQYQEKGNQIWDREKYLLRLIILEIIKILIRNLLILC